MAVTWLSLRICSLISVLFGVIDSPCKRRKFKPYLLINLFYSSVQELGFQMFLQGSVLVNFHTKFWTKSTTKAPQSWTSLFDCCHTQLYSFFFRRGAAKRQHFPEGVWGVEVNSKALLHSWECETILPDLAQNWLNVRLDSSTRAFCINVSLFLRHLMHSEIIAMLWCKLSDWGSSIMTAGTYLLTEWMCVA